MQEKTNVKTNVKTEKISLSSYDIEKAIETKDIHLLDTDPLKNLKMILEMYYHVLIEYNTNLLTRNVLDSEKNIYHGIKLSINDPDRDQFYNSKALQTLQSIIKYTNSIKDLKDEIDTLKKELELLKK